MKTVDYMIQAGEERLSCLVDYAGEGIRPSVICLHGGGPSSKESTEYLSPSFVEQGKSVIRFDFSGQGDSTGSLKKSSLKKRQNEVRAILDYFSVRDGLTVVGSSMGGYIATTLVRDFNVENLILFCPAAYAADAWEVGFSSGFTDIIRAEKSYRRTDIGLILESFEGKSLFVIGTNDEIIPGEVTEMYLSALDKSPRFDSYIIENCPHPIHWWSRNYPEIRENIREKVRQLLIRE